MPATKTAANPPQPEGPSPDAERVDSLSASLHKEAESNDDDAAATEALRQRQRAAMREYQRPLFDYHLEALSRLCTAPVVAVPAACPVVGNYPNPPAAQSAPSSRTKGLLSDLSSLTIESEPTEAPQEARPHWWIHTPELDRMSPYTANVTRNVQAAQLEADRLGMDTWDFLTLQVQRLDLDLLQS